MNQGAVERRMHGLLDPSGTPMLPGRISHDRRRRLVVEDLLKAMRERAQAEITPHHAPLPIRRGPAVQRRFWLALAGMAIAFVLIAFCARWAHQSANLRHQPLGASSLYGWLGFQRFSPAP